MKYKGGGVDHAWLGGNLTSAILPGFFQMWLSINVVIIISKFTKRLCMKWRT